MAKVLGKSGRYATDEAVRQRKKILIALCVVIAILGLLEGALIASYVPFSIIPPWGRALLLVGVLLGIWWAEKWGNRRIDAIDKDRDHWLRGADGEVKVGAALAKLSDLFCVINDLSTPYGNIDHVVVGPTGIFVLDSKAWRGIVTADRKGELLVNDKPTKKPYVRRFVRRYMGVRDKVLTLATGIDAPFNGIFVFTAAWVDARWRTTGPVNCMTDEQVYDYIAENKYTKKLNPEEITQIAQAFLGLAHMEKEFGESAATEDITGAAGAGGQVQENVIP